MRKFSVPTRVFFATLNSSRYIPRNGSVRTVEVILVLLYQPVVYAFCCVPLLSPGFLILDKPGIDILLVWVKLGKCSFFLYFWQLFIPIVFVKIPPYCLTEIGRASCRE